jgi:formate--tetrahydrofolate ligase
MHGGVAKDALKQPDPEAVTRGLPNLMKHAENVAAWGLPCVVAINRFLADSDEEIAGVRSACEAAGIPVEEATHFADGGRGAIALAEAVVRTVEKGGADFHPTYPDDLPLWDKVRAVAQKIYGADDIMADAKVRQKFRQLEADGYGRLPVCVAKTQYSFSTDPLLRGRPRRFDVPLRDVRLSAGAGFVVVLAGDIMTMPGLPKQPAAEIIDIDEDGNILGLS